MPDIDLTSLSKKERRDLLKQLQELEQKPVINSNDDRIKSIATAVRELASAENVSTSDVIMALAKNLRLKLIVDKKTREPAVSRKTRSKTGPKKRGRSRVEPKYQHPDDPTKTYAGKGPIPKWLKAEMANGKSKEDFLLQKN